MKWKKAFKLKVNTKSGRSRNGTLFLNYSYCYWSSSYASVLLRIVTFINQSNPGHLEHNYSLASP